MKHKKLLLGFAAAGAALGGCGGHDSPTMTMQNPPPPPAQLSLDTSQVLALARQSSEFSEPFAVAGSAVTLNDASDTSDPIAVDGS